MLENALADISTRCRDKKETPSKRTDGALKEDSGCPDNFPDTRLKFQISSCRP